jgi:magnesium transporter
VFCEGRREAAFARSLSELGMTTREMVDIALATGRWTDVADPSELPPDLPLHPALRDALGHREKAAKLRTADGETLFVLHAAARGVEGFGYRDVAVLLAKDRVVTCHAQEVSEVAEVLADARAGRLPTPAHVAWRLADMVVDGYLRVLDGLHVDVARLEHATLFDPRPKVLEELLTLKRTLIVFRSVLSGSREVLTLLTRVDLPGVDRDLRPYLVDVYDHLILAVETADMLRDLLNGSVEAYLSTISNRLNEVMKTLTIIATIMMPLTVITGIYGMNFRIPETEWVFGYPFVLSLMAAVALGMLVYFRRRRWI